jgi:probable HAF family extracellular repeat protein
MNVLPRVRRGLAAALFALPVQAFATYVFNTVEYPGAVFTEVWGINGAGQIVGTASLDNVNFFAFRYSSGTFTTLPPTLYPIGALGINDAGVIVGSANPTPDTEQAFIFNAGSYAFFVHGGYPNTEARAISNANVVTGYSYDALGNSIGWIYNPLASTVTDIDILGSHLTIAQGINAAGQVVGSATGMPGGAHAFLRDPGGAITLFQIGTAPTRARSINDNGVIAGWMTVGGVNQSFVGTSGGFETLMVAGSSSTYAEGLNNAGQVSGIYVTTSGGVDTYHGFIATPASMPTGTTASGAYTFSVAVIPNFPIFIDPSVDVGFDYSIGKGDPRFAAVRLPIGIGDNLYRVKVGGKKFTLAGGDLLDFRANGFPGGVTDFRVTCIDVSAGLDPANAQAFPTELTFVAAGTFTGTMKPLTRDAAHNESPQCD